MNTVFGNFYTNLSFVTCCTVKYRILPYPYRIFVSKNLWKISEMENLNGGVSGVAERVRELVEVAANVTAGGLPAPRAGAGGGGGGSLLTNITATGIQMVVSP